MKMGVGTFTSVLLATMPFSLRQSHWSDWSKGKMPTPIPRRLRKAGFIMESSLIKGKLKFAGSFCRGVLPCHFKIAWHCQGLSFGACWVSLCVCVSVCARGFGGGGTGSLHLIWNDLTPFCARTPLIPRKNTWKKLSKGEEGGRAEEFHHLFCRSQTFVRKHRLHWIQRYFFVRKHHLHWI